MKKTEAKFGPYEYIKYWAVTVFVFLLAVPVVIFKTIGFLVKATGAPLKSIKNIVGFVIVIIIAAAVLLWYKIYVPCNIGDQTISIMVQPEDSFSKVLSNLKETGVIKDDYLFRRLAILTGLDRDLTPGRYDFSGNVSLRGVLRKFTSRDIATVKITIPEGLTARQIAGYFGRAGLVDSSDFAALAYDSAYALSKYHLPGFEGYLFPETYRFWYGMSAEMILDDLIKQFRNLAGRVLDDLAPDNLPSDKIVILASIIEAEAQYADEMPIISSVYRNRLKRGMLLQADPTVIYAIGRLDRPLWYKDLEYDSPYNTYKYKGLPPGPINNPGLDAIKAATFPAKTDYLYFVADGTGRHVFSRTLREHNRAKQDYKKKLKEQSGS